MISYVTIDLDINLQLVLQKP